MQGVMDLSMMGRRQVTPRWDNDLETQSQEIYRGTGHAQVAPLVVNRAAGG